MTTEAGKVRHAPVQGFQGGIPWSLHLEAYSVYCRRYGEQAALIEGNCRGGFAAEELDEFIPGWRDKVSEIGILRQRIIALEQQVAELDNRCMVMLAELVAVNCASRHVYALDAINIFAESLAAQEKEHG